MMACSIAKTPIEPRHFAMRSNLPHCTVNWSGLKTALALWLLCVCSGPTMGSTYIWYRMFSLQNVGHIFGAQLHHCWPQQFAPPPQPIHSHSHQGLLRQIEYRITASFNLFSKMWNAKAEVRNTQEIDLFVKNTPEVRFLCHRWATIQWGLWSWHSVVRYIVLETVQQSISCTHVYVRIVAILSTLLTCCLQLDWY